MKTHTPIIPDKYLWRQLFPSQRIRVRDKSLQMRMRCPGLIGMGVRGGVAEVKYLQIKRLKTL